MKLTKDIQQLWDHLSVHWPEGKKEFLASVEAIALADALYRHHFPTNGQPVRLVVLSESPAFTPTKLMKYRMDPVVAQKHGISDASALTHLNLVHCLSYGESWTVEGATIEADILSNRSLCSGTPAFWRVLSALAGDTDITTASDGTIHDPLATEDKKEFRNAFAHVIGGGQKDQTVREQRLRAKVDVLRRMQERGIVFFDVCPLPIYLGGEKIIRISKKTGKEYWTPKHKLGERNYRNLVQTSFAEYALPLLCELSPERVVILGKKIESAIGGAQTIQQALPQGCQYLGVMDHPSYNRVAGIKYAPNLQRLRGYANPTSTVVCTVNDDIKSVINNEKDEKPSCPSNKLTDEIHLDVQDIESCFFL